MSDFDLSTAAVVKQEPSGQTSIPSQFDWSSAKVIPETKDDPSASRVTMADSQPKPKVDFYETVINTMKGGPSGAGSATDDILRKHDPARSELSADEKKKQSNIDAIHTAFPNLAKNEIEKNYDEMRYIMFPPGEKPKAPASTPLPSLVGMTWNVMQALKYKSMREVPGYQTDVSSLGKVFKGVEEAAGALLVAPIAAGLIANPVSTIAGVATFAAFDKIVQPQRLVEMLPLKRSDKDVLSFVAFLGELYIGGKAIEKVGSTEKLDGLWKAWTRETLSGGDLPTTVKLTPDQVRDIWQTGNLTTAEEKDMFNSLGLDAKKMKVAIKNGITIEIPAENFAVNQDKAWMRKIKEALKIKPFKETVNTGKVKPSWKPGTKPPKLLENSPIGYTVKNGKVMAMELNAPGERISFPMQTGGIMPPIYEPVKKAGGPKVKRRWEDFKKEWKTKFEFTPEQLEQMKQMFKDNFVTGEFLETDEQKELEKNAYDNFLKDPAKYFGIYMARVAYEYDGYMNVASGDCAKWAFTDNTAEMQPVHEAASAMGKIHREMINDEAVKSGKPVGIMAGISGAGKTSGLRDVYGKDLHKYAGVIDTNSNNIPSLIANLNDILEYGNNAAIILIYRDEMEAWKSVIERGIRTGRPIWDVVHLKNAGAPKTVVDLSRQLAGSDRRIRFEAIDNRVKPPVPFESIDKVPYKDYTSIENQKVFIRSLYDILDELQKNGTYTAAQLEPFRTEKGQGIYGRDERPGAEDLQKPVEVPEGRKPGVEKPKKKTVITAPPKPEKKPAKASKQTTITPDAEIIPERLSSKKKRPTTQEIKTAIDDIRKQLTAIKAKPAIDIKKPQSVTLEIPGDGSFKIPKTKEAIESFLSKLKALEASFKGMPPDKPAIPSMKQTPVPEVPAVVTEEKAVKNAYSLVGDDDKREVLKGILFEKNGITATDGVKLYHRSGDYGKVGLFFESGKPVEGTFPEYKGVVDQAKKLATEKLKINTVETIKLLNQAIALRRGESKHEMSSTVLYLNADKSLGLYTEVPGVGAAIGNLEAGAKFITAIDAYRLKDLLTVHAKNGSDKVMLRYEPTIPTQTTQNTSAIMMDGSGDYSVLMPAKQDEDKFKTTYQEPPEAVDQKEPIEEMYSEHLKGNKPLQQKFKDIAIKVGGQTYSLPYGYESEVLGRRVTGHYDVLEHFGLEGKEDSGEVETGFIDDQGNFFDRIGAAKEATDLQLADTQLTFEKFMKDNPDVKKDYDAAPDEETAAFGGKKEADNANQKTIEELEKKFGPQNTLRSEIAQELKVNKEISFIGRKIRNATQLAELFTVFRSPSAEHSHLIFVDEKGVILEHHAVTSGHAARVTMKREWLQAMKEKFQKSGAKKFYMLHNHPSGSVFRSKNDMDAAFSVSLAYGGYYDRAKIFGGSIIINGDKYGFINPKMRFVERAYSPVKDKKYGDWLRNNYGKLYDDKVLAGMMSDVLKTPGALHIAFTTMSRDGVAYNIIDASELEAIGPNGLSRKIKDLKEKYGVPTYYLIGDDALINKMKTQFSFGGVKGLDNQFPEGLQDIVSVASEGVAGEPYHMSYYNLANIRKEKDLGKFLNIESEPAALETISLWEAEQKPPEEIEKTGGAYVINRPMEISIGSGDKATAGNLRLEYSGWKNEQILRGNKLADEIRKLVKTPEDQAALFWYKAAEGNANFLKDILTAPVGEGETEIGEYRAMIQRAYKYAAHGLPPDLQEAMRRVDQYYKESGLVAMDVGSIRAIRENYMNRIYAPERPQDFVKTELKGQLKQSTRHGLQRVFDTEFDAIKHGKKFATTNVADALAIHNEEMANVNSSRKLADVMVAGGIAEWNRPGNQHVGWEQVGRLEKKTPIRDQSGIAVLDEKGNQIFAHSVLYAPKGIAKGLRAITDPNFIKQMDLARGLQKYQGLVKTIDLGFSLFHHFTFVMQALYQNNLKGLLDLPTLNKHIATPEFKDLELDFARHGGITTGIEENADILRDLAGKNPDTFQSVRELPVAKQMFQVLDASSNLLFNGIQRMLKVTDYGVKTMNWISDHPGATDAEIKAAKQGFAKNTNAVYGGLNWEAMGVSKWHLSLMRLGLLAPDWTTSNMALLKYAVADWSTTAGSAARAHIMRALLIGFVLTEGLNYILQGHFTDQNPAGHNLEVMIAPDVYVSFYRGGIGDILKYGSMVRESGAIAGSSRFLQGKMAPLARAFTGLASGVQYTGRPIAKRGLGPIGTEVEYLKYLLSNLGPMPFGLSGLLQSISKGKAGDLLENLEDEVTQPKVEGILPKAMVLSGLARYSKPMSQRTSGLVGKMRGGF